MLQKGHQFNINGKLQQLKGSLLLFCGDTPASNFIGAFKESVKGAL
jgi:hypothetical protein